MVLIPCKTLRKGHFFMDGYLYKNLTTAKKVIKEDWDMVFAVDGTEGAGKSAIAQQCAYYCYPELSVDNIAFNPQQFKDCVKSAPKYSAVVYDEAYGGLGSRASLNPVNMSIVRMLTEIRQKNLFIFIVMPTFFDLDRYVALWRSRALIHVYTGKGWQRGFFGFYDKNKKKQMYVNGKKTYSYASPGPNFRGRFADGFPVGRKNYLERKDSSTVKAEDEAKWIALKTARDIRIAVAENLKRSDLGLTLRQITSVLGVTRMTLWNYLHKAGIDLDDKAEEVKELKEEIKKEVEGSDEASL